MLNVNFRRSKGFVASTGHAVFNRMFALELEGLKTASEETEKKFPKTAAAGKYTGIYVASNGIVKIGSVLSSLGLGNVWGYCVPQMFPILISTGKTAFMETRKNKEQKINILVILKNKFQDGLFPAFNTVMSLIYVGSSPLWLSIMQQVAGKGNEIIKAGTAALGMGLSIIACVTFEHTIFRFLWLKIRSGQKPLGSFTDFIKGETRGLSMRLFGKRNLGKKTETLNEEAGKIMGIYEQYHFFKRMFFLVTATIIGALEIATRDNFISTFFEISSLYGIFLFASFIDALRINRITEQLEQNKNLS